MSNPQNGMDATVINIVLGIFVGLVSALSGIVIGLLKSQFNDLVKEVHEHQRDQILELDKVYDRIRATEIKSSRYDESLEWIKTEHRKNHDED